MSAEDLTFKATWSLPPSLGFRLQVAYGDGSLWLSDYTGPNPDEIAQVDARTGKRRTVRMPNDTLFVAWSEYGDLWGSHSFLPFV